MNLFPTPFSFDRLYFPIPFLVEDFTAQGNVNDSDAQAPPTFRWADAGAADLLEGVGLGDKLRRPSRHLSGGEQQRVAVARSLANDLRVILADRPTGNLDIANSERAFELLQNIVQQENSGIKAHDRKPLRTRPKRRAHGACVSLSSLGCIRQRAVAKDARLLRMDAL